MSQDPDEICANKHVLVVDDEEQNRYLVEAILKSEKCVVTCAENGLEALEYLKKDPFHLIISDILMPKMDGFHLCRECKFDPRLKDISFVFYTASYTDKKDEEFALSLGADRIIRKPIEPELFISTIRAIFHEYEKGIMPSKSIILKDEVPYLVEYNERIIQQLEKKANELDAACKLLTESEEKYRNIFENSIEGIFQTSPDGRFLTANPALARIHGYSSPEEFMSSITDIAHQLYVEPSQRQEIQDLLKETNEVKNFETQNRQKDGTLIWVSMNARAVRDTKGNILYIEGTVEDITDRKKAEEALAQYIEKLRMATGGIIDVITSAVELRDPYTSGHQKRVASLARTIAKEMGLPMEQIDGIRMAGTIHDLGKISIPAEILSMPRKLTELEFNILKAHPEVGFKILKDIDFPWPIAQMVYQHHERLNGSGYPQGLQGGGILLEAKIIGVADVVEAMASHRPYRPALGIDVALNEIEQNKVIYYDTQVVEVCVRLFREKGFKFE